MLKNSRGQKRDSFCLGLLGPLLSRCSFLECSLFEPSVLYFPLTWASELWALCVRVVVYFGMPYLKFSKDWLGLAMLSREDTLGWTKSCVNPHTCFSTPLCYTWSWLGNWRTLAYGVVQELCGLAQFPRGSLMSNSLLLACAIFPF